VNVCPQRRTAGRASSGTGRAADRPSVRPRRSVALHNGMIWAMPSPRTAGRAGSGTQRAADRPSVRPRRSVALHNGMIWAMPSPRTAGRTDSGTRRAVRFFSSVYILTAGAVNLTQKSGKILPAGASVRKFCRRLRFRLGIEQKSQQFGSQSMASLPKIAARTALALGQLRAGRRQQHIFDKMLLAGG